MAPTQTTYEACHPSWNSVGKLPKAKQAEKPSKAEKDSSSPRVYTEEEKMTYSLREPTEQNMAKAAEYRVKYNSVAFWRNDDLFSQFGNTFVLQRHFLLTKEMIDSLPEPVQKVLSATPILRQILLRLVGCYFSTSEKMFMMMKAVLFALLGFESNWNIVYEMYGKGLNGGIANGSGVGTLKVLGQSITGFCPATWDMYCRPIMCLCLYFKFSSDPALKELLLSTGDKHLIEASADDARWGVGFSPYDERAYTLAKNDDGQEIGFTNCLGKSHEWNRNLLRSLADCPKQARVEEILFASAFVFSS